MAVELGELGEHAGRAPARVLVVEDEPLALEGLVTVVDAHPELEAVASASTALEALGVLRRRPVDVVLCDLFLSDGDAVHLARTAPTDRTTGVPAFVVVTVLATPSTAVACERAGVHLCLSKDAPAESVTAACAAAARGAPWSGPGLVEPGRRPGLSSTHLRVLAGVASGYTNEGIAARLNYSPSYVKDVLASGREQLEARDRAHAAAIATARKLIHPTGDGAFAAPEDLVLEPRTDHVS